MLRSVIPFPIKETWTHEFCCLTNVNQTTTPSASQNELLKSAGLAKTKIVFKDKHAVHAEVCTILEETFPQLKNAGGYTLHRAKSGGQNRPLLQLKPSWYDIKLLKKEVTSSACIYIRPLQQNLDLTIKANVRF